MLIEQHGGGGAAQMEPLGAEARRRIFEGLRARHVASVAAHLSVRCEQAAEHDGLRADRVDEQQLATPRERHPVLLKRARILLRLVVQQRARARLREQLLRHRRSLLALRGRRQQLDAHACAPLHLLVHAAVFRGHVAPEDEEGLTTEREEAAVLRVVEVALRHAAEGPQRAAVGRAGHLDVVRVAAFVAGVVAQRPVEEPHECVPPQLAGVAGEDVLVVVVDTRQQSLVQLQCLSHRRGAKHPAPPEELDLAFERRGKLRGRQPRLTAEAMPSGGHLSGCILGGARADAPPRGGACAMTVVAVSEFRLFHPQVAAKRPVRARVRAAPGGVAVGSGRSLALCKAERRAAPDRARCSVAKVLLTRPEAGQRRHGHVGVRGRLAAEQFLHRVRLSRRPERVLAALDCAARTGEFQCHATERGPSANAVVLDEPAASLAAGLSLRQLLQRIPARGRATLHASCLLGEEARSSPKQRPQVRSRRLWLCRGLCPWLCGRLCPPRQTARGLARQRQRDAVRER